MMGSRITQISKFIRLGFSSRMLRTSHVTPKSPIFASISTVSRMSPFDQIFLINLRFVWRVVRTCITEACVNNKLSTTESNDSDFGYRKLDM